jgi:pseudouridine-5'-phosphate glycosidase
MDKADDKKFGFLFVTPSQSTTVSPLVNSESSSTITLTNSSENWINKSVEKAKLNNIRGKNLTPFLITEINALSKNKTLEANTALIINNALLAGKISKKFNS